MIHKAGKGIGWTPLHVVSHRSTPTHIAGEILRRSMQLVNSTAGSNNSTPLMLAAGTGLLELVKSLILFGANPNLRIVFT